MARMLLQQSYRVYIFLTLVDQIYKAHHVMRNIAV